MLIIQLYTDIYHKIFKIYLIVLLFQIKFIITFFFQFFKIKLCDLYFWMNQLGDGYQGS